MNADWKPVLFDAELARLLVEHGYVGKRYVPSNGTEGEIFWSHWCEHCERDRVMNGTVDSEEAGDEDYCDVLNRSFWANDQDDHEWKFDERGQPICTAFVPFGEPIPHRDDLTLPLFPAEEASK